MALILSLASSNLFFIVSTWAACNVGIEVGLPKPATPGTAPPDAAGWVVTILVVGLDKAVLSIVGDLNDGS